MAFYRFLATMLRSTAFIYGVPGLEGERLRKVTLGNAFVEITIMLMKAILSVGGTILSSSPNPPSFGPSPS